MATTIKRDELKKLIESDESFKLVNTLDAEYFEAEHICGSINIPTGEIEKRAGAELKKDDLVVVYCAHGSCNASEIAGDKLESLGYTNVVRFTGGMGDWKDAGYCIVGSSVETKAA